MGSSNCKSKKHQYETEINSSTYSTTEKNSCDYTRMLPIESTINFDSLEVCKKNAIHQSILRVLDGNDKKFHFDEEISKQEFFNLCEKEYSNVCSTKQDFVDMVTEFYSGNLSPKHVISWYVNEGFFYKMIDYILRQDDLVKFFQIRYAINLFKRSLIDINENSKKHPRILFRLSKISEEELEGLTEIIKNNKKIILQLGGFVSTSKILSKSLTFGKLRYPPGEGFKSILYEIKVEKENLNKIFDISNFSSLNDEYLVNFNSCVVLNDILPSNDPNYDFKIQISFASVHEIDPIVDKHINNGAHFIQEIPNSNYKEDNFYLIYLLNYFRLDHQMLQVLKNTPIKESNLVTHYNNFGVAYSNLRQYDNSLDYYYKALKKDENEFGDDHPNTANSYNNIGNVYIKKREYDQALNFHFKALKIRETRLGCDHPFTAYSHINIGLCYFDKREFNTSLEYFYTALKIRIIKLGKDHLETAHTYYYIGCVYYNKEDYHEAEDNHKRAIKIREDKLGVGHTDTASSYNDIGEVYCNKKEYDTALDYFYRALYIRENKLGYDHHDTAHTYYNIGVIFCYRTKYEEALELHFRALKIRLNKLGESHIKTAQSYYFIAYIYSLMRNCSKAFDFHFKALQIREVTLGYNHPDTATSYHHLGNIYFNMGEYPNALDYYTKALKIRESTLVSDHPNTLDSCMKVEECEQKLGLEEKRETGIENLNFQPETAETPEPDDSCGNETLIINSPHNHDESRSDNRVEFSRAKIESMEIRENLLGSEDFFTPEKLDKFSSHNEVDVAKVERPGKLGAHNEVDLEKLELMKKKQLSIRLKITRRQTIAIDDYENEFEHLRYTKKYSNILK